MSKHERTSPVLRTIGTMLALTASVTLLAGCGSAGHASSGSSNVDAGVPISSAQAVAYAHAVNLRAADAPGMTSQRNAEVVIHPRGAHPFLSCAGIPAAKVLLEIHSTILNAPYWWMRSTVGLLPNEALAAAYVSALGSSRGVSGRGGLRPPALAEPYVTVSRHTAPTVQSLAFRSRQ